MATHELLRYFVIWPDIGLLQSTIRHLHLVIPKRPAFDLLLGKPPRDIGDAPMKVILTSGRVKASKSGLCRKGIVFVEGHVVLLF